MKREIIKLVSCCLLIFIFGLIVMLVTRQDILREQEQIRHELETSMLEEIHNAHVEIVELETVNEALDDIINLLEEKVTYMYEKVLENKDYNQKYKQDLENMERYIELIVKYFDLDNHPDKDSFELWLYNNHRKLYDWALEY